MLRVVLDTNVFVSGLLNKTGLPATILDAWRAGRNLLIRDYHGSEKILGGGQAKEYSRVRFPIQGTLTGGRDLTQSIIIGL